LTPAEQLTLHLAPKPITLSTAAKPIVCKWMVWVYVQSLDLKLEAYVGPGEHRPLIGLVKLCRESEMKFLIDGSLPPGLEFKRSGKIIRAESSHDVPTVAVSGIPAKTKDNSEHDSDDDDENYASQPLPKPVLPVQDAPPSPSEIKIPPPSPKAKKLASPNRMKDKGAHNVLTHFPRDENCEVCRRATTTRARCISKKHKPVLVENTFKPERFADSITLDPIVLENEQDPSRYGHRYSITILDRATNYVHGYPVNIKTALDTKVSLQSFLGPNVNPKHLYSDNSKEIKKAIGDLGWKGLHDKSTPNRSETNGVVERANRRLENGTSAVLIQSGLNTAWWADAMEAYSVLHCVQDIVRGTETPYRTRFGIDFDCKLIPFGTRIEYKPSSQKGQSLLPAIGDKLLLGIFMGYGLNLGGDWDKNLLIVDKLDLKAAETTSEICIRSLKNSEVSENKAKDGSSYFPVAKGHWKQPPWTSPTERKISWGTCAPQPQDEDDDDLESTAETDDDSLTKQSPTVNKPAKPTIAPDVVDFWTLNKACLVRHHMVPRLSLKLCVPVETDTPIPLEYLDVMRTTTTELGANEAFIEDHWIGRRESDGDPDKELSSWWTGTTIFMLRQKTPPPKFTWVMGRLIKEQKTNRPPSVYPEQWTTMSPKNQRIAIADWRVEGPKRTASRQSRGLTEIIPPADGDIYDKITAKARADLDISGGLAPAMACIDKVFANILSGELARQPHIENVAPCGERSDYFWAMTHTPVKPADLRRIPEAKESIDKEFDKLDKIGCWGWTTVREKHEVQAEAKAKGETAHFGSTMELGFIKHSQLAKKYWVYKGRIVFRGDNIRDEKGVLAVFSEQAASASHVEAARSLDALARMPDCDGFDIDAIGAFHQIPLGKDCPTTWCSVPKHRQPPEWAGYKNPVCIMGVNLYGHPQAQNY
jgi:hypothetical protein